MSMVLSIVPAYLIDKALAAGHGRHGTVLRNIEAAKNAKGNESINR